jgi:hypothetical protein
MNRRKSSTASFDKNKSGTKNNETRGGLYDKSDSHEHMDSMKKYEMPIFMGPHRKSDAEKSSYADADKGNPLTLNIHLF